MNYTDNQETMSNYRSRRTASIHEGISLLIVDNPLRQLDSEGKNFHLNFIKYCFVFRCTDLLQCKKYFKKASRREYVILLFHNFDTNKIQTMISQFESYEQIQAIFVLHRSNNTDELSSDTHLKKAENTSSCESKIKSIEYSSEAEPLLSKIQQLVIDAKNSLKDAGLFFMCNSAEKALRDLREELGSFVWTHTFRVLLVAMPHNSPEAKRQMVRECRRYYRNDHFEMKKIEQFKNSYRACDAILWYTKPGFLSTLVNKILRSENVHALYIFRYFIFDLCESLAIKRYSSLTPISVYRGTILRRDEVEQLHIGSSVSTNGFLSSSEHLEVAMFFISSDQRFGIATSRSRDDPQQFVLFKIDIDLNQAPDVIVADIGDISQIRDEHEFLFDLGTTFIITNIFFGEKDSIWHIQMRVSNEFAQRNHQYDSYMRGRLSETNANILFGRMLVHLSEYSFAIKYFHRLLRALPLQHEDRPSIHYELARMYRSLGKHQQAIHYFRCAKLLQRRSLPYNKYEYGKTLAGLGTVYMELNDSKKAVSVLEQASICYNLVSQNYNTETMFHFNRLSYAYYLEQQHERALHLLNKVLVIYKEKMPVDHPGHAQAYHNLGLVHRAMDNREEGLLAFKEALRMRETSLAPTHPYVARTCYQIGLLFEDREEFDSALEYAKKALHIQELKLPSNHGELNLTKEFVQRLSIKNNLIVQ